LRGGRGEARQRRRRTAIVERFLEHFDVCEAGLVARSMDEFLAVLFVRRARRFGDSGSTHVPPALGFLEDDGAL
jgi:hypothetical protein